MIIRMGKMAFTTPYKKEIPVSAGEKLNAKIAIKTVATSVITALLSPDNFKIPNKIMSSSTGVAARKIESPETETFVISGTWSRVFNRMFIANARFCCFSCSLQFIIS